MKVFLFVLLLSPATAVWAVEPLAPTNVTNVVSEFSFGKTGDLTVYRALTLYGGGESGFSLSLEKYKIGEYGSPDKLFVQKNIFIPEIKGFKPFMNKILKKSTEATYGCCEPKNLRWNKNKGIIFNLEFEDRIFKRGFIKRNGKKVDTAEYSYTMISHFTCISSALDSPKFKIECDKVKAEKVVKE